MYSLSVSLAARRLLPHLVVIPNGDDGYPRPVPAADLNRKFAGQRDASWGCYFSSRAPSAAADSQLGRTPGPERSTALPLY